MWVATFWWENVFEKPRGSLNYLRKVQLSSQTRFSLEFSGQSYVNNVCVFLCFVCLNIYGPSSIIKILTWLQGFLVIDLYLVWFSLCSGLFWESQDNGVMKNLPFCLWSLGVILEQTYRLWSIDDITGVTRDVVLHWHLPECNVELQMC